MRSPCRFLGRGKEVKHFRRDDASAFDLQTVDDRRGGERFETGGRRGEAIEQVAEFVGYGEAGDTISAVSVQIGRLCI